MFEEQKTGKEIRLDEMAFDQWIHPEQTDKKHMFLKRAIAKEIKNLTEKQREYVLLWAAGNKMVEIAKMCGVDKSTVSRTIKRAKNNLKKPLKLIVEWNEIFTDF